MNMEREKKIKEYKQGGLQEIQTVILWYCFFLFQEYFKVYCLMTRRICIVSHIFGNQKEEFKSVYPTKSKTNTCVVNISFT